jgi:hypothetical protein
MYENLLFLGHGNTMQASEAFVQHGFCVRRGELQNSTEVFQLNISNKTNFCASISRPNAKPENVCDLNNQQSADWCFKTDESRSLDDDFQE